MYTSLGDFVFWWNKWDKGCQHWRKLNFFCLLHCILIWIKVAWFERQAFRKSIISWIDRWFIFSSLKKEMQWNDGYLLAALELFPELKQYQMLLQGCWNRGREAWGPTGPSNSRKISPYSNRGRVDYAHQLKVS